MGSTLTHTSEEIKTTVHVPYVPYVSLSSPLVSSCLLSSRVLFTSLLFLSLVSSSFLLFSLFFFLSWSWRFCQSLVWSSVLFSSASVPVFSALVFIFSLSLSGFPLVFLLFNISLPSLRWIDDVHTSILFGSVCSSFQVFSYSLFYFSLIHYSDSRVSTTI